MAGPREDASEAHPRAAGLLACLALILGCSVRPEHGASRVRRRRELHVSVAAAGAPADFAPRHPGDLGLTIGDSAAVGGSIRDIGRGARGAP